MKMFFSAMIFTTVLAAGFFACTSAADKNQPVPATDAAQNPTVTKTLPAFAMTDANGNTVDLSSFKGKKVFVNLWATWCAPCREEMPSIQELATKVDDQQAVFIMLSLDENFEDAKQFAKKKLALPVYYPAEKVPGIFDVQGIPATFIFDESGALIKQNNGADDYNTQLYIDLLGKK